MAVDFILNGQAHGDVASRLLRSDFDLNTCRMWLDDKGRTKMTVRNGNKNTVRIVRNANATLRKDEWIDIDRAVIEQYNVRMRAVQDLVSRGLTKTVPNGMGTTILQHQTESDITDAIISMSPTRMSDRDRVVMDLTSLPLPIIHKNFSYDIREIAVSRKNGVGIDVRHAAKASRKVLETVEKLLLGLAGTYAYGGGNVYGYTNYPNRNTKVITAPTASGWSPATLISEVLAMIQQLDDDQRDGPIVLYVSTAWSPYLDDDYSAAKGDLTLRDRLKKIDGIEDVRTIKRLTNYDMVGVQMDSDTVQMVIGMPLTTLQWEEKGGMEAHFKVMTIMVPQLFKDFADSCGIIHAAA